VKKGNASVGVQRQYCGRLGKLENCQVGVFLSLGRGTRSALVDFRLFLPQAWAEDASRCEKAKVPETHRVHHTKTELALQMVRAARERGSTHQWIGGDEVYGNNQVFTAALEELGEVFLMDVARNTPVWQRDPTPPAQRDKPRGPGRPGVAHPAGESIKVEALTTMHFARQARELKIRESTRAGVSAKIWVRKVWLWDEYHQRARARLLVVRQEADGSFKYSLSNAPTDTPWERLAYMQAQRFWIERAFQDAKSELGMAQYELRGWSGWHHHMTLVCMALLFLTRERCICAKDTPLLSARDIVELLAIYLPRRSRDQAEVIRQIKRRHLARQRDIDNRSRRARQAPSKRQTKVTK
jgi:SRSO17 transposase